MCVVCVRFFSPLALCVFEGVLLNIAFGVRAVQSKRIAPIAIDRRGRDASSNMQQYAPLCTTVPHYAHHAPLCPTMHHYAPLCTLLLVIAHYACKRARERKIRNVSFFITLLATAASRRYY